ncbi:MAG: DNA repair protein RecO [Patescibacteria group bacterium]
MLTPETKNTLGIVIKRRPLKEYDRAVVVYTRDFGKLNLAVRGAERPNSKLSGHIEPFSLIEAMIIKGKHRDYLGAARSIDSRIEVRQDLNRLFYAGAALATLDRLTKEAEPDKEVFFLTESFLEYLDQRTPDLVKEKGEVLLVSYIWKLLANLGYLPRLDNCLICGAEIKENDNRFDALKGGLVCPVCADRRFKECNEVLPVISWEAIKVLRFLLEQDFYQIARLALTKELVHEINVLTERFKLTISE